MSGKLIDNMSQLQFENLKLKKTVKSLLWRIEDNQRIDRHFQGFEFKLLNSNRLTDLLQLLLLEARGYFDLADVGLILVDRDFSIRELLRSLGLGSYQNRLQLRNSDDFAFSLYSGKYRVVLGEQDALATSRLFPNLKSLGSAALLPLMRNQTLIGSLHFASPLANRFTPDKASDFMNHLASIAAVCLDNCLAHEHLQRHSRMDMLTQVSNRLNFEEEYAKELERSERSDDPLSCMFVDVDYFKKINDTYGHQTGDRCLKEVAAAIRQELRKTDILARYGGEEFVVILHRCEHSEALVIAERVRAAVASLAISVDGQRKVQPTVSVGLASWQPRGKRSPDLAQLGQRLLSCADAAMYTAKRDGRNRVEFIPFVPAPASAAAHLV